MAATIRDELGLEVELVRGAHGVFDVQADGELLFSKHRDGTFPRTQAEVIEALRVRMG